MPAVTVLPTEQKSMEQRTTVPISEIIKLFEHPNTSCLYSKAEKAYMFETVMSALREKEERDNLPHPQV